MTTSDETLIETYVWRRDALSDLEKTRAERLLRRDAEARAWACALRDLYAAFDAQEGASPEQKERAAQVVDDFVGDLFEPAPVIPLTPVPRSAGPTVLAADDGSGPRFELLMAMASMDDGVLVRILVDHERDEARVYVLAQNPVSVRPSLFEADGVARPIYISERGTGVIPRANSLSSDALQSGRIRRCLWDGPLPSEESQTVPLELSSEVQIQATWTGSSTLHLQVHPPRAAEPEPKVLEDTLQEGGWPRWAGCVGSGHDPELVSFTEGAATLTVPAPKEGQKLRLFG